MHFLPVKHFSCCHPFIIRNISALRQNESKVCKQKNKGKVRLPCALAIFTHQDEHCRASSISNDVVCSIVGSQAIKNTLCTIPLWHIKRILLLYAFQTSALYTRHFYALINNTLSPTKPFLHIMKIRATPASAKNCTHIIHSTAGHLIEIKLPWLVL